MLRRGKTSDESLLTMLLKNATGKVGFQCLAQEPGQLPW
jgi:hypothetical protein